MQPRLQLTFDAHDPPTLAAFWALALGYVEDPPPDGFTSWDAWLESVGVPEGRRRDRAAISDPDGTRPRLFFQKVPEEKTAKNRVHVDIAASGGPAVALDDRRPRVDDKVAELVAAGATQLDRFDEEHDYWVVLADPEGNEFCVM